MDQRRPRGEERNRERRRSRTRSQPPLRREAAALPSEGAAVACTRANLQPLFTSFKDMMKLVEVERFLLAHHRRRGRAEDPPLTVVRGLLVRYNYDGYRLGLVARYLVEDGEDKVAVQASLQGGEGAPSRRILLECLSSQNSLADPGWEQHGEHELADLSADMLRHAWRLPLGQVAGAAWRRQAALRWHARYRGEPDMAAHLHRLIADLEDRTELQRAAAQLELLPQPAEPVQQERQPRQEFPVQQRRESPGQQRQPLQESPRRQRRESPRPLSRGARSRSPQRQRRDVPPEVQQQLQQQGRQGQGNSPQRLRREGSQRQLRESPTAQPQRRDSPPRQQQADKRRPAGQAPAGLPLAPAVADAAGASQLAAQAQQQQGGASAMPVMPAPSASHVVPSFINLGGSSAAEADAGTQQLMQPARPLGIPEMLAARQAAVSSMAAAQTGQLPAAGSSRKPSAAQPHHVAAADTWRVAAVGQPQEASNEAAAAAGSKRKRAPLQWQAQEPQPGDAPLLLPDKKPAAQQQAAAAAEPKAKEKKQRVAAAGSEGGGGGAAATKRGKQAAAAAAAAAGKFQITVKNLPPEGEHGLADDGAARHGKGSGSSTRQAAAAAASSKPQLSRRERAAAAAAAADHKPLRQATPGEHGNPMPPGFDGGSARHQPARSPPPGNRERGGSGGRQAEYAPAHGGSGDGGGRLTVRVRLPPAAAADDDEDYSGHRHQLQQSHQHQQQPAPHAYQAAAAAPPSTLAGRFDGLSAQFGQRMDTPPPLAAAAAPSAAAAASGYAPAAFTAPGSAQLGYAPQQQQPQQQQQSVFPAAGLAAVAQMYGQGFDPTGAAGQLAYLQQLQQTPPLNAGLPAYPQQYPEQQVMLAPQEYAAAAPVMAGGGSLQGAAGYGGGSLAGQAERGEAEALAHHHEDEQAEGRHVSRSCSGGAGGSRGETGRTVEIERRDRSNDRGRGREANNGGRVVEAGGGRGRTAEAEGRGDRSGGSGSADGRSLFWDPLWQWESDVVQLLQSRASGVRLTELQVSHPLPPCWAQTPEALYAYLSIRKQLFTVHHPQKGGRENILVVPAKGARPFLIFKRRLLQFLADRRPRTSARAAQRAALPTAHLMPALQREAEADFVAFVSKYFRDEVGVVPSMGGGGGDRFLLELRPFAHGAGGRDAPDLQPAFAGACKSWQSKGGCKFGDACYNTHAPRRSFTDRITSQRR